MGEKGRIQTQNIFGTVGTTATGYLLVHPLPLRLFSFKRQPVSRKEVELRLVDLPGRIRVEEPFPVSK